MSDYKTRDDLIKENDLLRAVIEQKNELINGYRIGSVAAEASIKRAMERLAELKEELKGGDGD